MRTRATSATGSPPALQRFAYLVTGFASDASDLVQEALSRAYPRWAELARSDTLEAYVRRSIVNASISAAVVVAVLGVVGGTSVLAMTSGDGQSELPAASGSSAPPTSTSDPNQDSSGRLPAPEPGRRWVSWRNVAVQVPDSWGYGVEPMLPWCRYDSSVDVERAPYVAQDSTNLAIASVGCAGGSPDHHPEEFGPAPALFWAPHVSFGASTNGASERDIAHFQDWTLTSRVIGDVKVSLLVDGDTVALADRILDSARAFETDQNGCDASSPVQAAKFVRPESFDLASVDDVESTSVCQYTRSVPPGQPALMGSRLLARQPASALLDAIRSAPEGGGPDSPQSCLHDMYGDTAITLRLHADDFTPEVYVYYDWCFGNGFDDGTTRRELTLQSCLPLFGGNVALFSGSSAPFQRCHE